MSWGKKTLGELCLIEKGKIGIQKAVPGEYPLVVTAEERLSHNEYHFEGNAVVIPLVSSTGHGHRSLKRIHFQSGKFAVGNILCAVIPHDENVLRADYLYRFLDLNKEIELVGRMKGMANVSLPIKEIARIEIPVPPIEAQIDFVKQYSTLEDKSNDMGGELTHQLNLVKQLRQAFLREAMQGKLVSQDPNDEPASVLLEKIKAEKEHLVKEGKIKKYPPAGRAGKPLPPITEEEIPFEIPENWVWCRLGEITHYSEGGKSLKGLDTPCDKHGWGVIKTSAITSGQFLEIENKSFSNMTNQHHNIKIHEGDLLFCRASGSKGLAGKSCIVRKEPYSNLILSDKSIRYILSKLVYVEYIHWYNSSVFGIDYYLGLGTKKSTTMNNITRPQFDNLLIPLPPLSEQQRIVSHLDQLMQYCDDLEASIKKSQQQNELLLQQVLREALEPASDKSSVGRPKEMKA